MHNTTPRKYDANCNDDSTSCSSRSSSRSSSCSNNNFVTATDSLMQGFPYPACWSNDDYMEVLMGPFRLRSLNPENYDSQMKFWQDMITNFCEHKGCVNFNKRTLQLAFARKECVPYGLDKVLEEMHRTKIIRLRQEYEYDPENSWTGWAINSFVKKPLSWGISKIPIVGRGQQNVATVEYVHVEAVKKLCRDLQTKVLAAHAGQVLHFGILKQHILESMQLTEESVNLCLLTLHCQKRIGLEYSMQDNEKHIHLIKIPSKSDTNAEITETNRAVHNLQMTQSNLLKQLEGIEDDIKANEDKARQYLKEGKRQLAKTYLRKKQLLEKNHEKRSLALHNVETLLCSVDEAQSNGEILDAYKIGSKALQNMLNASGLKYDNVDEVISDVRDTIEAHNEVQDTLANANLADSIAGNNFDDDSLERELKEIMGEPDAALATTPKPVKSATAAVTPAKAVTTPTTKSKSPIKTNVTATSNSASQGKTPLKTIEITDAELLAMLEGLEVEENSPSKSAETTRSTIAVSEQL